MRYALKRLGGSVLSDDEKITVIAEKFTGILKALGLDPDSPSLKETPKRVATMYVKEIFVGLKKEAFPKLTFSDFTKPTRSSSTVVVKNIQLVSHCEHHFVPMVGVAHIAYLPKDKVIGLSKLNRIAKYFASRPQLQERLTCQIAESLAHILQTPDVAVFTEMSHFCVQGRGVLDKESTTRAHFLLGRFESDPSFRQEFLWFFPEASMKKNYGETSQNSRLA